MAKLETGKNTGGTARKIIRDLDKSITQAAIGRQAQRSSSTIGQIKNGGIKNPPESLIKKLRNVKKPKK